MKKNGVFSDKICITASSQVSAHKAPVSFVVRRGIIIAVVAIFVLGIAACAYITVNALLSVHELTGTIETLQQTVEIQNSELEQYEQQLGDLRSAQQAAEQSYSPAGG